MADRTVSVGLKAKVSGFVADFKLAQKSVGDFSNKLASYGVKNKQSLNSVAAGAGIAGVALLALGGVAVKSFANFDSAMSRTRAATHETAANMNLLRDAALEAGARTKFSATEAADAETELAKAGVKTADILGGALNGALDLAAAGELGVADAAETAATAMTQFKLSGKDVPHIADLLAASAGKAQGEVSDMAMALKQSGLVAAQMGLSIEDTTGTLAAFASAGLIGSDAGTSLRTMLLRLANPSSTAADLMKQLGINAYDAQGNFVGIEGVANQLQKRLGGLTQQQRDSALATIFGSDAIRAANVLYDQGSAGIHKWVGAVNDQGFAAETAAIKMDNLAGDLEKLKGSLETTLIGVGSGANGPLRQLVQNAEDAVNKFGELPEPIQQATLAIIGGGGLALLGVAGLAKLIVTAGEARAALVGIGLTAGKVGALLKAGLAFGAVAGLAIGIDQLSSKMNGLSGSTSQLAANLKTLNTTNKTTGDLTRIVGNDFDRLGERAQRALDPSFKQKADAIATGIFGLNSQVSVARDGFKKLDEALTQMNAQAAAKSFEEIKDRLLDAGYSLKEINSLFPEYRKRVKDAADATAEATARQADATAAARDLAPMVQEASDALKDMDENASGLTTALELLNATMGNVEAESKFEGAIDAANKRLTEYHKAAKKGDDSTKGMKNALDLSSEAGRDNVGVLTSLWESTTAYATQVKKTTGDQGKANRVLGNGREQLVKVAAGFLGSRTAAEKYVTEVLGIPKNVSTKFTAPGLGASSSKADHYRATAHNLNGFVATTTFREVHEIVTKALGVRRPSFVLPAKGGRVRDYTPIIPMAEGGFTGRVSGPGSGTSDTAGLFALSNGEFISTAKSTDRNIAALVAGNKGARLTAEGMTRGGSSASSSAGGVSSPTGGALEGTLYLDSGEFLGIVRGEISQRDRGLRRRVVAGTGATK